MISVIVPVYQVEKFLDKCVQSILAQTYQDLEVILVDDGSKDGSPKLCDQYAQLDPRVRVIHKKNGGLSDARNAGLEVARGEYLSFIDSDDYIHPQMYERVVAVMEQDSEIDVAVWSFEKVQEMENDKEQKVTWVDTPSEVLSHDQLIPNMFSDQYEIFIVAWNKLFRREVWGQLRFPKGRIHEDQFTTYKPLYSARKVVYIPLNMYYYRQRQGSIMSRFQEKACLDDIEALTEKMQFFEQKKEWEYAYCASRSLEHMIYHYKRAKKYGSVSVAKQIKRQVRKKWKQVKCKGVTGIPRERRAYFNSFLIADWFMVLYMKLYWKGLSVKHRYFETQKTEEQKPS